MGRRSGGGHGIGGLSSGLSRLAGGGDGGAGGGGRARRGPRRRCTGDRGQSPFWLRAVLHRLEQSDGSRKQEDALEMSKRDSI